MNSCGRFVIDHVDTLSIACRNIYNIYIKCHFAADLDPEWDPACHVDADPDPTFTLKEIRILIWILASNKGPNPYKSPQIGSHSIHFGLSSANC